ncbi:hypothetical protein BDN71DRAFT_1545022 [Pleurotus eryngii]|uniref:Ricin B lectin domain-containing protein n=1 Tax=Pleurotus eryngii TaxID=5323 RepID=A0A9P5ZH60_PLEER|nr:hypothetical protein BDN71DRAFT_1545022 [Pleurotus eryngii]
MFAAVYVAATLLATFAHGLTIDISSRQVVPDNAPTVSTQIHPFGVVGKCLSVKGNVMENGTPVQIFDCNGSSGQNWSIVKGQTKVQLAGTNFCLDAGSEPASGVALKIWTCYDNLPAQNWWFTNDNRIAVYNKGKHRMTFLPGQCMDFKDGSFTNSNTVQTWKCTDNNTNQEWSLASVKSGTSSAA